MTAQTQPIDPDRTDRLPPRAHEPPYATMGGLTWHDRPEPRTDADIVRAALERATPLRVELSLRRPSAVLAGFLVGVALGLVPVVLFALLLFG